MSVDAWLDDDALRAPLVAHAIAAYPSEACAIAVGGDDTPRIVLAENLADHWHARDPDTFPRTSATAYILDPMLIVDAARRGEQLRAIIHSHCDVGAYFSDEDARLALTPDGRKPLFPGVAYVVLDVRDGAFHGWRTYRWSPAAGAFVATR